MNFALPEEKRALAAEVRQFATERIAPFAREGDRNRRYRDGLLADIADAGLFALRAPRSYGGGGLDRMSVGIVPGGARRCGPVLLLSRAQRRADRRRARARRGRRAVRAVAARDRTGEAIIALALTEPGHGTDAAAIEMRAAPADGGWILEGEKTSIMAAAYATHALVFARTGQPGARGISAFYVSLDDPAVRREPLEDLGCRAGGRGRLVFDGLFATEQNLVGAPGEGLRQVMRGFAVSWAYIALMAIAVANAALDHALEHAKRRTAFGAPLGTNQSLSFPLVEHTTLLRAARLLAYESLWQADQGRDPRLSTNMVKWWAPKAAFEAVHQCLLTLGHLGWDEDGPIAKRLRDVVGLQLADGTAAATKLLVARQLLGREYARLRRCACRTAGERSASAPVRRGADGRRSTAPRWSG